eukprot:CAMPEP_0202881610 /NCGR_PEP_ID=MMETSP1391-20130828/36779_1 /ASSEMBLY_ACC=CAM_ASM_000867 /TAXON_ID=1034604 /ORGANISM="Chlamydomonas leiostraca, Strain SAG 11-49" /LENGTH=82 /DNA_ID=CAMNT_0049564321 /DNA_START=70 /DNA_END=314 /DNA_ORIENTATION=-
MTEPLPSPAAEPVVAAPPVTDMCASLRAAIAATKVQGTAPARGCAGCCRGGAVPDLDAAAPVELGASSTPFLSLRTPAAAPP